MTDDNIEDPVEVEQEEFEEKISQTAPTASSAPTATTDMAAIQFDFVDHFSLKQPSSTIRSRSHTAASGATTTRIYDLANDQLQLQIEEKPETSSIQVSVQRVRAGNLGLRVLRSFYTLAALLMAGFVFLLGANIIVMQAMEIPRNSGQAAGESLNVPVMIANILGLPMLVYSMASAMVFASAFVTDTWNGHPLFILMLGPDVPRVYMEWYCFLLYAATPAFALIISALMGQDEFHQTAGLVSYFCMLFSFCIFSALLFFHEVKLSLDLTHIQHPDFSTKDLFQQALVKTLTFRYSGREEQQYLAREQQHDQIDHTASVASSPSMTPLRTNRSLYSRSTLLNFNPFFDPVNPPQRRYSPSEMRETVPVVTYQSWSLSKICCETGSGRSRYAVAGPNALEPGQFKSAFISKILCVNVGILIVASILYAMGQGAVIIIAAVVVGVIFFGVPCIFSAYQVYRAMPQEPEKDDGMPVYQAWSSFTVSKPKEWYCWFRLLLNFVFLFLWPLATLFAEGLIRLGCLFLVTSLFSAIRYNLDAGAILSENCTLSHVDLARTSESNHQSDHKDSFGIKSRAMMARAKASEVLGKVTNSKRAWFWTFVYTVMGAYFIYSGYSSSNTGETFETQEGREPIRLLDDFYYPPQKDSMLYPNCKLTNQYAFPGVNNTYALDYNMLAGLAYETPAVTDYVLDKWFQGKDLVIDETEFVSEWRNYSGNSLQQVSFKLFSVPSQPGIGVLSIRGTETPMDALFNIQMYLPTVLTMVVRALMPFSWIWDPIYDDLAYINNWVASDHLKNSEYYRITTDFANDLLQKNYKGLNGTKEFHWLRTTGVSLGGGLALITGAQTDAWAFAYSGPNPTLGRKTFNPTLTMKQLKEQVINIKPDNDFVSSLGDLVPNYELVRCRDWPAKVNNCHSFWRIFCEYLYTCGSPEDRSGAFCVCVYKWGYPEPERRGGNLTFDEACDAEEANMIAELGDIFGDAE